MNLSELTLAASALFDLILLYILPRGFFDGDWHGFVIFAFSASVTPGPNNSLLFNSGLHFGVRRSLPHFFGVIFGFSFLLLVFGILLHVIPPAILPVIKWLSYGLILFVAYKIATQPVHMEENDKASGIHAKPWGFFKAVAFQWINPKGIMMSLASLTVYGVAPLTGAVLFGLTNVANFVWLIAGVLLQRFIRDNPKAARVIYWLLALTLIATLFI